jgi:hypothetical protein
MMLSPGAVGVGIIVDVRCVSYVQYLLILIKVNIIVLHLVNCKFFLVFHSIPDSVKLINVP